MSPARRRAVISTSWDRVQQIVRACGLALDVSIAEADPVELATMRRNLDLTTDERFMHAVSAARFVLAGRSAVGAKERSAKKRR